MNPHTWKHKKRHPRDTSISIDFDGCLVSHAYPDVGQDVGAWPYLTRLYNAGVKLYLNTARSLTFSFNGEDAYERQHRLDAAINYVENGCQQYDIDIDVKLMHEPGKLHAHIFLDDHGLGTPTKIINNKPCVDWDIVGPWLLAIVGLDNEQT